MTIEYSSENAKEVLAEVWKKTTDELVDKFDRLRDIDVLSTVPFVTDTILLAPRNVLSETTMLMFEATQSA